ncbi:MAG: 1-acyl-sn-glycerol-3-phosphate acyltransferase [Proteiniphilum sp.]
MIDRYDFRYTLAKIPVNTALRLNFRKLVFIGKKENVSKKRAIIFAPNHRNALIDALMLVFSSYHLKQIVFLARADIFKKSFVAWLLKGMRIMPVFRIRDGKDNLDKNNEIFDNAARILHKNNPIALFPEARHNPRQSLLPVQKAVPRIILPTEASVDFQLRSQIVPVSIYYRDMFGLLSDAYITFGSPIEVSDYKDIYYENPVLAINQLRQELEKRLKSMVVDIWNDEFYDEYCHAIDWNGDRITRKRFPGRKDGFLQAALYTVRKLDEIYENDRVEFDRKIAGFREAHTLLKEQGLTSKDRIWEPSSGSNLFIRFTALILSAPVAFLGLLNGIFPILINKKLSGLFKDKQFIPSARYASGLFFIPIFNLIQSLIVGIVTKNWLLSLGYFILMPLIFYFGLYWRKWFKAAQRDNKVRRFKKQHPTIWSRVLEMIRL